DEERQSSTKTITETSNNMKIQEPVIRNSDQDIPQGYLSQRLINKQRHKESKIFSSRNPNIQSELQRSNYKRSTLTSLPISIDGNSDFATKASLNSWTGDGSSGNPYILENLVIITSVASTHAISIQNTNVYFILRNSTLTATGTGGSGLYLINVHNGIIHNNTANNNTFYGFYLKSSCINNSLSNNTANSNIAGFKLSSFSDKNSLSYNTANSNNWYGFFLQSVSNNNSLSNNIANYNSFFGFYLDNSYNNSLSNNMANYNTDSGFYLESSQTNSLINNTANYNALHGFYLYVSSSNTLNNNSIINGGLTLYCSFIYGCLQAKVEGNTVNGLALIFWQHITSQIVPSNAGQIILVNSSFITIRDQIITNTFSAIKLYFSSNNTIFNNTANNNTYSGFDLYDSWNNSLSNNTANYNTEYGFLLLSWNFKTESTRSNILSKNTANSNKNYGFFLFTSSNNTLNNNTAKYNDRGFYLNHYSESNTLSNNKANFNTNSGFCLSYFSKNNTLSNNTANSNSYGFYLYDAVNNNNFSLNYIGSNIIYGVFILSGAVTNRFTNNTFINNNDTLIQAFSAEISTIFEFNFWSDHLSPDANNNGIVDTAYVIDGPCSCQDNTPVTFPYHEIAPTVTISSPTASFYNSNSITLTYSISIYSISKTGFTIIYIDDVANTTLLASGSLLTGLSDGIHNITIVVTDGAGNTAKKDILFTIDTMPPTVTISSPTASFYNSNSVILTYSISETTLMTIYIDDVANTTSLISGSLLTGLNDGLHNVTIVATDEVGNTAIQVIQFTVDTTTPTITITSPTTSNYDSNFVTLTYSVSETVTVTVYIDDIITSIVNNSLIEGLADGTHNITIKTVDNAGNVAYSEVLFTIITSSSGSTSPSSSGSTSPSSSSSTSDSSITSDSPGFTVTTLILLVIILIPLIVHKRGKRKTI
ncbi:MAG: NosD domain-containing protein, partial [Candidatus Hodarchaeales archaeon]